MTTSRRDLLLGGLAVTVASKIGLASAAGVTAAATASSPPASSSGDYETVFYQSGKLKIEAYLYRPMGTGPFPLVIYNHGARSKETVEAPTTHVGELLTNAGYAALVVEGPGYGRSDGTAARTADVASLAPAAADVLAAVAYIKTLDFIDQTRLGMMGWSLGGAITLFAMSTSAAFRVAIDQAGASLNWTGNAPLQKALVAATAKVKIPVYFMDAQNDETIEAVTSCADAMQKSGVPHKLTLYPPFFPKENPERTAAGHQIFGPEGVGIWGPDAIAFLNAQLMAAT